MNTKLLCLIGNWTTFGMPLYCIAKARRLMLMVLLFGMSVGGCKAFCMMDVSSNISAEPPIIRIDIGACTPAARDSVLNICFGYISIKVSATDDDTPQDDLRFEYKIDLYNDGVGAYNGYDCWVGKVSKNELNGGMDPLYDFNAYTTNRKNPFDASGRYPIGIHKICWNVEDTSGLSRTYCELFELYDCKAPTPIIITGIFSVQMKPSGCISVLAKDLDRGSHDNCTTDKNLKFYFDGDKTLTELTVCCDDFAGVGVTDELLMNVEVWIEDEEGNLDYVKTVLSVKDPFNICGRNEGGKLSGSIYSILNKRDTILTKNVSMELYLDNSLIKQQLVTKGNYLFTDLAQSKYSLRASKDDEHYEFVSICDRISIMKHILGIGIFETKYQQLLADVNNSQTITAEDHKEINKLILREVDYFSNRPSWLVFPVIDSIPMSSTASVEVDLKPFEKRRMDFRAFKVGDVNNLVSSDNDDILIPDPTDSLVFIIKNKQLRKGEKINLEFYTKNFYNIEGYQFTIKFDRTVLKFDSTISNSLSTSDHINFGLRYSDLGYITTCWTGWPSGIQDILQDEVLFTFAFEALDDGMLCDLIQINSDLTPAEVCKDSAKVLNKVVLEVCDVIIKTKDEASDLFLVYPNPFKGEIHFQFSKDLRFPLIIQLLSSDGKIIAHKNLKQATSLWIWEGESLTPGIYFLSIRNEEKQLLRKIIFANNN